MKLLRFLLFPGLFLLWGAAFCRLPFFSGGAASAAPQAAAGNAAVSAAPLPPGGALDAREKELLNELLRINLQLEEYRRQSDSLAAALAENRRLIDRTGAELARARARLAAQERRLGGLLAFVYRYGETSLLSVLLGARSFSDFLNQSFYLSAFLSRQAAIIRETHRLAGEKETLLARLELLEKETAEKKTLFDEAAARTEQLKQDRLRLLAEARRQSQDLARRLLYLEERWGRITAALREAFRKISALPAGSLSPDRFGFSGGSFYAEISAATVNRLLREASGGPGEPASLSASVTPAGVTLSGSLSSPAASFSLGGSLVPDAAGEKLVFRPESLEIDGVPVEKELLAAVTTEEISWDLGEYLTFWKISAVKCAEERVILTLGGKF